MFAPIWQSTYNRNGKTMVQSEKQENGKVIVYEREIQGDELHVVRWTFELKIKHTAVDAYIFIYF